MTDTVLPPKKRDWKPGTCQVGIFMRTQDGSKVEMVFDSASPEICACVSQALEHAALKPLSKPSRTFDEWAEMWKKRFDDREAARLASEVASTT